jgi:hypothetical protein
MKFHNRHRGFAAVLFSASAILALLFSSLQTEGSPLDRSEMLYPAAISVEFRGCESAHSCRFWIESLVTLDGSLLIVRPNGIVTGTDGNAIAIRNRLNSLLSNMIHQHKRIELLDLRELNDGIYSATIMVNGMDVRDDPILHDLMETAKK